MKVGDTTVSVETDLYWSASRLSTPDYTDIVIDSIALTASPCRVSARPVTFLPGALDHRGAADRWRDQLNPSERELLQRAAAHHLDRRARGRNEPLIVQDAELSQRSLDQLSADEKYIVLSEQADAVAEGDPYWKNRPWRYHPGRIISVR